MSKRLWLLLASVGVAAFIGGYGATAKAWHTYWHGYFFGTNDFFGLEVLPPWGGPAGCQGNGWAVPTWVDTPNEFTNFVVCKLGGSTQERRGAAFIISTMIGQNNPNPTGAQIAKFVDKVNYAASRGWINFSAVNGCILPNTFYQDAGSGDVAKDNTCGIGPGDGINFYNGSDWYIIKRFCGNPVGNMPPLAEPVDFNMSGWTTIENQTNAARGSNPYPGDNLLFRHWVRNNGPTNTGTDIWAIAEDTVPSYAVLAGWGNFGWYAAGETKNPYNTSLTVPGSAAPGSQYCRTTGYRPVNAGGGEQRGAQACATVQSNFNLVPSINVQVNGASAVGNFAEPGDSVTFSYAVTNTNSGYSFGTACNIYGLTRTGYYTIPSPADNTSDVGYVPPPGVPGCPRDFPGNNATTPLGSETVTVSTVDRSVCRSLYVNPATPSGPAAGTEVCTYVAVKPYLRVYGGDVSAGNGQPAACTSNANAAVIGWNQRAGAPAWAGAGTKFATYALNRIFDFSSTIGNPSNATTAAPPADLSFANTSTNVNNGDFGGFFGSVPCTTDYYNTTGASALVTSNLSLLAGVGRYSANGPIMLFGNINPNQRTVVYVEGDVLITGNITYTGSWNVSSMPLFQLVAKGNIYISQTVTQLDGVYIAQQSGASGGTMYTCANPALPATAVSTTSGASYTPCRNKLTINGAFVAKQVQFLRTNGTQRSATAGEASSSANLAEVFNFSPAIWIAQPPTASSTPAQYDAITSLPPVL